MSTHISSTMRHLVVFRFSEIFYQGALKLHKNKMSVMKERIFDKGEMSNFKKVN